MLLALPTPVDVPATPYAAIDDESEPVVDPLDDDMDPLELLEPLDAVEELVAPPAPPVPVVSSHAARCATLTASPSETATAARLTLRTSVLASAVSGAPQCGHAGSLART